MADWKKILATYAPLIPAVAVAAAVVIGLSGYETPTYAVSEYSVEESVKDEITEKITKKKESETKIGTGAFDVPDGTYQGSGTGYGGTVTLSVTIQDKTITAIDILSHSDTASFFSRAQSQVVADILANQTADVDAVSGATYSSNGIMQAVRNALHVAAGEETEALSEASGSSSSGGSTSPVSRIAEPSSYKDGTYTGSGVGFNGAVTTVQVTVSGGKIVSIGVVSYGDTTSYFLNARDPIISSIIAGQTTNVDTVSGATFSSNGLITAVRNALAKAAGENVTESEESEESGLEEVDESGVTYKDGTYTGTADGFAGEMKVEVVVEDGKIKSVTILSTDDTEEYLENAKELIEDIISGQTTNVDTVSGATFSSKGIVNAVRAALEEAKTDTDESSESDESSSDTEKMVFDYADGIYVGVGEGYSDDVILGLTIRDKTLVAITVLYNDDTPAYFKQAQEIIRTIVNTQNTEVDAVSGATFSSEGILEAVKNALENAEKGITILDLYEEKDDSSSSEESDSSGADSSEAESSESGSVSDNDPDDSSDDTSSEDSSSDSPADDSSADDSSMDTSPDDSSDDSDTNVYNNGTFTGTAVCAADEDEDFDDYNLTLTIVIQDDKVTAITDITGDGDSGNDSFINRAANGTKKLTGTVAKILANGTTDGVDSVSGATCSSKAIVAAVQNAMENARK